MSEGFSIVRRRHKLDREAATGYLLILPTIGGFVIFSLIPTISVITLSFFNWDLVGRPVFIGIRNYSSMLLGTEFWHVLGVTGTYVLYSQLPKIVVALCLALLLNKTLHGLQVFRVLIIVPWIVMPIAVGIVWKWLLDSDLGLVNYYLGLLGISKVIWFSTDMALKSIAAIDVWQYFGFATIIFLIGLQNIPVMYYEAATIDGAGRWKTFWQITAPLLRPTTLFLLVTSIIGSFQVFDIVYATTQGGPGDFTKVYYYSIWQEAFSKMRMGYASAMCVVLFLILMILTLAQLRLFRDTATY
jgi:ABC-type sugar transport system permease subunit